MNLRVDIHPVRPEELAIVPEGLAHRPPSVIDCGWRGRPEATSPTSSPGRPSCRWDMWKIDWPDDPEPASMLERHGQAFVHDNPCVTKVYVSASEIP